MFLLGQPFDDTDTPTCIHIGGDDQPYNFVTPAPTPQGGPQNQVAPKLPENHAWPPPPPYTPPDNAVCVCAVGTMKCMRLMCVRVCVCVCIQ